MGSINQSRITTASGETDEPSNLMMMMMMANGSNIEHTTAYGEADEHATAYGETDEHATAYGEADDHNRPMTTPGRDEDTVRLISTKTVLNIGTLNTQTPAKPGKMDLLLRELDQYKWHLFRTHLWVPYYQAQVTPGHPPGVPLKLRGQGNQPSTLPLQPCTQSFAPSSCSNGKHHPKL